MPHKLIPPQTTTATRTGVTPLQGELFYDTDENQLYYGDGATTGGVVVGGAGAFADLSDVDTTGLQTGQAMVWNGAVWVPGSSSTGREVLTADRTYYVRTDGNDSNDGLSDSAGGAFLTIQKAFDVVETLDQGGKNVTIQFTGTFNLDNPITVKRGIGGGLVVLDGGSPSNSLIQTTVNHSARGAIQCNGVQNVTLKNFKIIAATVGGGWNTCVVCRRSGFMGLDNLEFGENTTSGFNKHIFAETNGVISILSNNYAISGGAGNHYYARDGGIIQTFGTGSQTVTITNNPTFTVFAQVEATGYIQDYQTTYSGTAIGQRYSATLNGVINQFGATGSYQFPGSVAGTVSTGGQYA